ncbi:MAG: alpha/beta fold hydrolase [Myxococcales bacterium]|nr:alpha/beta fold hydrolase [Myxococcales bacterium]
MNSTRTVRVAGRDTDRNTEYVLDVRYSEPIAGGTPDKAVIAAPHPQYGGEMSNPVVRALEEALRNHGLSTLAFDYRGVGGSTGKQRGSLHEGCQDLVCVGQHELARPLSLLAGYSFGACAALGAAGTLEVSSLLLVAPPLALLEPAQLAGFAGRLRVIVGEHDEYAGAPALKALVDRVPGAQLLVLPDTDHFFTGSQLERLRDALPRALTS